MALKFALEEKIIDLAGLMKPAAKKDSKHHNNDRSSKRVYRTDSPHLLGKSKKKKYAKKNNEGNHRLNLKCQF